jgi:PIN domain-containing protein
MSFIALNPVAPVLSMAAKGILWFYSTLLSVSQPGNVRFRAAISGCFVTGVGKRQMLRAFSLTPASGSIISNKIPSMHGPLLKSLNGWRTGSFVALHPNWRSWSWPCVPYNSAAKNAADDYETLLSYFPNLQLEPVSRGILLEAAGLRARYGLRSPDAIQLATGLQAGATLAVTNDRAWRKVPYIKTLIPSRSTFGWFTCDLPANRVNQITQLAVKRA